jgi:aryl-alcohol dehydrogenase-like predicted oxidoreductase/predicted kinase
MSARGVGLGCFRLSVAERRDTEAAIGVITTAVRHGVNLLDTAPSYGLGEWDAHHNERLVRLALESLGSEARDVRVATKVGLVREGAAWVPDGRARSILASCEASLEALGRQPLDLVLLHAVDPRVDLAVTARALGELVQRGLAREVGACNVSLKELAVLRTEAPITAVQVAWSPFEQRAARGGVVADCLARDDLVMVHSPFGGPKRAPRVARGPALAWAEARGISPHALFLAVLYGLSERLVPLPGASRVETAIDAARARLVTLTESERRMASELFGLVDLRAPRSTTKTASAVTAPAMRPEIVVLAGPQGAGKSTRAAALVASGYERLSRDERGGTLAGLHRELDRRLRVGGRFVLDNTYLTRADRHPVVELAARHGAALRLVFCDAPSELLQARIARRLVESLGHLPGPDALRALSKQHPNVFPPSVHFRALRAVEPPLEDEGFDSVEVSRASLPVPAEGEVHGVAVLWDALSGRPGAVEVLRARVRHMFVFAWCLPEDAAALEVELQGLRDQGVATGLCAHGGGPPVCWCRPPMPGLLVQWVRSVGVDPTRVWVIGRGPAHRTLARGIGARFSRAEELNELFEPK